MAMRKRRILGIVSICILLAISLKVAISYARFHTVERHFEQVQKGQTSSSVISRLGRPNYHEGSCSADFSPPQNCAKEYVYSHPFAPLIPEYYVVWFSSNDQVLFTENLISP
jgi:hypothetical protein